jgi:hypothetical protein
MPRARYRHQELSGVARKCVSGDRGVAGRGPAGGCGARWQDDLPNDQEWLLRILLLLGLVAKFWWLILLVLAGSGEGSHFRVISRAVELRPRRLSHAMSSRAFLNLNAIDAGLRLVVARGPLSAPTHADMPPLNSRRTTVRSYSPKRICGNRICGLTGRVTVYSLTRCASTCLSCVRSGSSWHFPCCAMSHVRR